MSQFKSEETSQTSQTKINIKTPQTSQVNQFNDDEELLPEVIVSIPILIDRTDVTLDLATVKTTTKSLKLVAEFWTRYLAEGRINTKPPYQRDSVWTPTQERAFIGGLMSSKANPPAIYAASAAPGDQKRKSSLTLTIIDGKQRCTALDNFFSNRLRIAVVVNKVQKYVTYKDLCKNQDYSAVMDLLHEKTIDLIVYEGIDLDVQETIFRMLNNGTALSVEEKLYCPNFLTRRFLDHCYDFVFETLSGVFKRGIRSKERFKHIKVIHELLMLSSGGNFSQEPRPRVLGSEGLEASARMLHSNLRGQGFTFDTPLPKWLESEGESPTAWVVEFDDLVLPNGFTIRLAQMRDIADRFVPIFALLAGGPLNAKGGVVARNAIDAIAFIHYLILKDAITLDEFLEFEDDNLNRWLTKFYESKIEGHYNYATNDIDTMIAKYRILADHFFTEVVEETVPADITSDFDTWERQKTRKNG